MFVLALFSLVSVALAAGPCCPPKQWEGNLALTLGTYDIKNQTGHFAEGGMRASYDADRKLAVFQQSITWDGQPVQQLLYNDYNTGIMYIAKKDGSCYAQTFINDLLFCIPDNATLTGNVNFGFADNLVNANTFEAKFPEFTMYMAVTPDTCVPVTWATVGSDNSGSAIESIHYSDITVGIADDSIFNLPAQCTNVPVGPTLGFGGRRRSVFH